MRNAQVHLIFDKMDFFVGEIFYVIIPLFSNAETVTFCNSSARPKDMTKLL